MESIDRLRCPWLFCCCGECARPRAIRIRMDGIEWTPAEWVEVYG